MMLAASLVEPDKKGRILLRCINLSDQPVSLKAGSVIGEWVSVEEADVQPAGEEGERVRAAMMAPREGRETPEHLRELLREASKGLESQEQKEKVEELLWSYKDVFSQGEHDIGLTQLVQHEIPTMPGVAPIKQPPPPPPPPTG